MTNSNQKERFQTKIAMLEQNNQVLQNKCEEYLGELIRTRKALEQSEICCAEWEKQALDYKAENIDLSDKIGKLEIESERTRKALEIAVDALKLVYQGNGDPQDIMRYKDNRWTAVRRLCMQALDEITALEQKD